MKKKCGRGHLQATIQKLCVKRRHVDDERDTFMNWDMTEIKASTVYVHEIPVRRHTRSTEK